MPVSKKIAAAPVNKPDDLQLPSPRYVEVAVDAPVQSGRTFSYSVPPTIQLQKGQLVRVPFGPRRVQGIVVELVDHVEIEQTRDVLTSSSAIPPLTDAQLALGRWISDYYMSSLFDAFATMLPPGGRLKYKTYYLHTGQVLPSDIPLTEYRSRVLNYIIQNKVVDESTLVAALGPSARSSVQWLLSQNLLKLRYRWAGTRIRQKTVAYSKLPDFVLNSQLDALHSLPLHAHRQRSLLQHLLSLAEPIVLTHLRRQFGSSAVNGLLTKGLLGKEIRVVNRDPLGSMKTIESSTTVKLTPAQEAAVLEIRPSIVGRLDPSGATFLLEGVTGSGKTEVYLEAVADCISSGKRAIVLVPEISLTPQTIERFSSRFPGQVAVLHSGLSSGQRFDQWWKIQQGDYDLVIGSRSSIFAPIPRLGLIVIDEEHEWTYKQTEHQPRYHAREVAIKLAELTCATLLMGTASPDVATYYTALHRNIRLLRLPERVMPERTSEPGHLAPITIVDMRTEFRDGNSNMFSRQLESALHETIQSGAQAILFLNRRGTASYTQCRNCGYTQTCHRCDTPMTYHKNLTKLLCHYCGSRRNPLTQCPVCLRYKMILYGTGTEAVQHEVQRMFPDLPVYRWDRDSVRKPSEYQRLLDQFRQGDASILVGTQMIAKGLHIPSVTLVGVISADVGLGVPDYRAGERVFQLLFQVAGRAGRGLTPGRAIIQTFKPDNYAIRAASDQNYVNFYQQEIRKRRELNNPPYSKLIKLLHSHISNAICEAEAFRLSELLRNEREASGFSDIRVLGPTPAFPTRLRGHYRWQIIIRGSDPRGFLAPLNIPNTWSIDVDPAT